MPVEARTRITLFVPAPGTLPQFYLVDKLLTDLLDACDGVTVSSDLPAVFAGLWFNDQTRQTERDANLLILADAPVPLGDAGLAGYLDRLKLRCQQDFDQDIIWITVHSVHRVTTDDYVR